MHSWVALALYFKSEILTYNLVCSGFALFVCLKSAPAMQLLEYRYLGYFGIILNRKILTYDLVCCGFALFVCLKSAPAIQLFKYVGLPTKAIPLYFL